MKNAARLLTIAAAMLCAANVGYGQDGPEAPKPPDAGAPPTPGGDVQGRLEAPKVPDSGTSLSLDYLPHYRLDDGGQDFVMFLNDHDYPTGTGRVTTDPTTGVRYRLAVGDSGRSGWYFDASYLKAAARGTAGTSNSRYNMGALLTSGPYRNQDVFEDDFTHAYASLALDTEIVTWDFGRRIQFADDFDLRLFVGPTWLTVRRDVFGAYLDAHDGDRTYDSCSESFRGGGVRLGVQLGLKNALGLLFDNLRIEGFDVYGKAAFGMIEGETELSWFEFNPDYATDRYTVMIRNQRIRHTVTASELGVGLTYTHKIGGAATTTAALGYEYSRFEGLLKNPRLVDDTAISATQGATTYDLTMSGAVASLSVSF